MTALALANYRLRLAKAADVPQLGPIELAAAKLFRAEGISGDFLDRTLPLAALEQGRLEERLWVAVTMADDAVGFVLATLYANQAHLEELDVHPSHARQGLGASLVRTVIEWARANGQSSITLSTFRDVPYNAPFYARFGFRPLGAAELTPPLAELVSRETELGLPMGRRVIMRLALTVT